MRQKRFRRFGDLDRVRNRSGFVKSLNFSPLTSAEVTRIGRLKQREMPVQPPTAPGHTVFHAFPEYSYALMESLADFRIDKQERERLIEIRMRKGLRDEQVRAVHACVFAWAISMFTTDQWLDDLERQQLAAMHDCLLKLGWAPGI